MPEEGKNCYAILTALQKSRPFRSCPHVTLPILLPSCEVLQSVASHLRAKDKLVIRVSTFHYKNALNSHLWQKKWQPSSARSNVTTYADNLLCLWYVLPLHHPQTLLFSKVAMWCALQAVGDEDLTRRLRILWGLNVPLKIKQWKYLVKCSVRKWFMVSNLYARCMYVNAIWSTLNFIFDVKLITNCHAKKNNV